MPLTVGDLSLYCGPKALGAPDDLLEVIVDFIDGARASLDVAVQELESEPIAQAIIAARQRGVRVRAVLEADYLRATRARREPWQPGGTHERNRTILSALLRARVWVRSDFNAHTFHQKFIVRDGASVRHRFDELHTNRRRTESQSRARRS